MLVIAVLTHTVCPLVPIADVKFIVAVESISIVVESKAAAHPPDAAMLL